MAGQYQWKKWFHIFFIAISSLLGIAFLLVGCVPLIKPWLIASNLIADEFAIENLKANVHWSGYEWLIGLAFLMSSLFCLVKIKSGSFKFIYLLFLGSLLSVYSLIMVIAPKVEQYSQHAAIEFYEQCAKHKFYVETIGFKSYATLFYGELEPTFKTNTSFNNYVLQKKADYEAQNLNIDVSYSLIRTQWMKDIVSNRTCCFVSKLKDGDDIKLNWPQLKELYRKNGFIFYVKETQKNKK
jgi:hypothetical protein